MSTPDEIAYLKAKRIGAICKASESLEMALVETRKLVGEGLDEVVHAVWKGKPCSARNQN